MRRGCFLCFTWVGDMGSRVTQNGVQADSISRASSGRANEAELVVCIFAVDAEVWN